MLTERLETMSKQMDVEAEPTLRFCLRQDVGIEDFGDRSLVLLCDCLHMREINRQSSRLLALADGKRTIQDIAAAVATECGIPAEEMVEPVTEALLHMERQGIVRRMVKLTAERTKKMHEAKYLVNPEVSFRQEEEDGGILFNADTDSIEVINPTAVEIWTFLAAPRTQAEVTAHLCEVCADVPREQVDQDVAEFIESLVKKGFIGMVEKPL